MELQLFFTICVFFILPTKCHKICSSEAHSDACQQLARDFTLACNNYLHNVDCLLGIQSNQSHVGRITGEQAVLGANLLDDNVIVLGEIRDRHPVSQTAVVVKSSIADGFINLKDKKFCHPGFEHDKLFPRLLLKELENEIVKLNGSFCDGNNITLVERHVRTLHDFFGNSCRPGLWSQDTDIDKTLKEKYGSLCSLCGSSKCDTQYTIPFRESLKCLTDNDADVALTTLQEAQRFFNLSNDNQRNYKYLCKDGSSKSYLENCTWSSMLPDLLVAERNAADRIKSYLQEHLGSKIHNLVGTSGKTVEQSLTRILSLETYEKITLLQQSAPYKSLKEYVQERRKVPTYDDSELCQRTFNWCTYTDMEQEKCKWLSQAAMNYAIQPVVKCARSEGDDELSCLDDIKKATADIVVASSDYAYISLNKGLKSIAYPETDTRFLSTVLVVRRENDTSISTFSNLKAKKACIPRFGGKEHLAFIDALRSRNIVDDSNCDYGNLLSDFVSDSCVPGTRSSLIRESTQYADKDKLCSLCQSVNLTSTATFCNDNDQNKYFGSAGALKCLYDNIGDFAVISKIDAEHDDYYRVICKNNTLSSRNGLQVDDPCALGVIASSEVVSRADDAKNADIILALYEFESWFGQDLDKPFHLFDRFNNTLDLLFRDSTPGLSFSGRLQYMKDYQKLLERAKDCKDDNNNSVVTSYSIFISVVSFALLLYVY